MKHAFSIEGYSYSLYPVTTEDAPFIVEVRLEDLERNRFIHTISPDVSLQVEWIEKYYNTPDDYYFVVKNKFTGRQEGLISIYNIDQGKGEWGRWVIKKDSLASVESFYLMCRIAFEQLELNEVYSRTIPENQKVVSFHDSVNAIRRTLIPKCITLGDEIYDAVEHFVDKEHFLTTIKPRLDKMLLSLFERNNKATP
jgi:RimJ/RimL family protein N-acetyltransferase